uniref:TLC domain-containing protein n=1 Tax=Calcidiscus leptoporus TaxID=127549 RepID=A0A7S0JBE6_9EUKA
MNATWKELGSVWNALFHYAFFGYLAKDMTIPMTAALYAHHVLCLVLTVLSLAEWPYPCSAVYVAEVLILEVGSLGLGLQRTNPTSRLINLASLLIMSASNVMAAALAVWFGLYFQRGESLAGRWVLPLVGFVLMGARQDMEWKRWRAWWQDRESQKTHAA